MKTDLNLSDIYRDTYPNMKRYTWQKSNPLKQARLDYFLGSNALSDIFLKCDIKPGYRSDHSTITFEFELNKFTRGKGVWKMNNSLLKKNDYINTINKIIQEEIMKFALPVYDINFLKSSSGNIYFKIDSDLFLELLFLQIRGETIKFASVLKKQTNNREKQLIADIESIESDENLRCIHSNLLTDKKSELQNLRESKIKGEAIRSRAQWLMEGQKPSSFFCNLERRNFVEKTIKKLQDKEGHYITAQGDILKETEKFYTKPFQNKDNDLVDIHLDKLLAKVKINKVKM